VVRTPLIFSVKCFHSQLVSEMDVGLSLLTMLDEKSGDVFVVVSRFRLCVQNQPSEGETQRG